MPKKVRPNRTWKPKALEDIRPVPLGEGLRKEILELVAPLPEGQSSDILIENIEFMLGTFSLREKDLPQRPTRPQIKVALAEINGTAMTLISQLETLDRISKDHLHLVAGKAESGPHEAPAFDQRLRGAERISNALRSIQSLASWTAAAQRDLKPTRPGPKLNHNLNALAVDLAVAYHGVTGLKPYDADSRFETLFLYIAEAIKPPIDQDQLDRALKAALTRARAILN